MNRSTGGIPECCARCPYLDQFHASCSHPLRQTLLKEVAGDPDRPGGETDCSVYSAVRANAMTELENQVDS